MVRDLCLPESRSERHPGPIRDGKAAEQSQDAASGGSEEGGQSGLVIIEEKEGNYRSAAGRKKTKTEDASNSVLKAGR